MKSSGTLGEEWRGKWLLEKRWQNASTEELIHGMNDINDHVRLAAVAACNKAAEVRQRKRAEQGFGKRQTMGYSTYLVTLFRIELSGGQPQHVSTISLYKSEQMIQNCTYLLSSSTLTHIVNISLTPMTVSLF